MSAATIKLVVEYQDNCASSVAYWSGSPLGRDIDHAKRLAAILERRWAGAVATVFVWCPECSGWEEHDAARCVRCSDCRCTIEMERVYRERGESLCEFCEGEAAADNCTCSGGCVRCVGVSATGPI